jgi:hypothetical protein
VPSLPKRVNCRSREILICQKPHFRPRLERPSRTAACRAHRTSRRGHPRV